MDWINKTFFVQGRDLGKIKWLIRKKVERGIKLTGFPLKTCGNDEEKQSLKVVILGLDPGIQDVFNLNTKDTIKSIKSGCMMLFIFSS